VRGSDVAVHSFDRTLFFLFLRRDTLIHCYSTGRPTYSTPDDTENQETGVKTRKEFIFCALGQFLISSRPFFSALAAVHHRCLHIRLPHHLRNLVELS